MSKGTYRYAALPSSISLLLPLVAVFLLQSLRLMHMSRPHWRRKKQLTSTKTRTSSRPATPSPTTAPRPKPLNRDSAKAGQTHRESIVTQAAAYYGSLSRPPVTLHTDRPTQ